MHRLLIKLRTVWFVLNVVILTVIFGCIGLIGSVFERRGKMVSWVAQTWSKIVLFIGGILYRTIGLEKLDPNGQYIFAANHESAMDIPLAFGALKYHLVSIAKIELKKIPILGWVMTAGGHIFVDRRNHSKALKSLENAKASMTKNPRSILIFPEGTRSLNGDIKPFKKGGLVMAIQLGIPVVPIALCGTRDVLGKNGLLLNPQELELRIGKPIRTENIHFEDRQQFVADVRQEVVALKNQWKNAE